MTHLPVTYPGSSALEGGRRIAADALHRLLVAPSRFLVSRHGWKLARQALLGAVIAAARNRPHRSVSPGDPETAEMLRGLRRDLCGLFARLPGEDPDLRGFLIASVSEATLPSSARGAMGAVYTDAALARFTIAQGLRALGGAPRRVLDPACGAGAFLAEAAILLGARQTNLVGIDCDREAIAAARARMAFLSDAAPGARCTLRAGDALRSAPDAGFDLVIGNPPYVRQETMGGMAVKRALAAHLERALPGAGAALTARADLSVAFFLLGLASLREGGALAYVTTNAWLDALYGRPLRRFLSEQAEVRFVSEWEGKVFATAAANPVVAVISRRQGGARRAAVFTSYAPPVQQARGKAPRAWRTRRRRVGARRLSSLDRWGATLLRGADLLEEIIASAPASFAPLDDIAALHYGTKPGLVDFFILDSSKTDVEARFLLPVLTSTLEIGTLSVRSRDLPRRIFVCPIGREELLRGRYPGALAHVLLGERSRTRLKARHTRAGRPYPEVPSVRHNAPWYRLRPRPPGDFAIPLLIRERHMIVHAREGITATNMFYQGRFPDRALSLPGTAILNSALSMMAIESLGRINIGGRINVYGPEIRALRIADPRTMSAPALHAIRSAFEPLSSRPIGPISAEAARPDRRALDVAVLDASGIGARYAPLLAEALEERVASRLRREQASDGWPVYRGQPARQRGRAGSRGAGDLAIR
ncbi:MAG: N-6 DNA methylase [Deltaproteobacteria bacterium]|nr:N-6 DNA methylase [Deltaproteobacteria bacterium]